MYTNILYLLYQSIHLSISTQCTVLCGQDLENATRWALETAVPLSTELSSSPLEDFWKALRTTAPLPFGAGEVTQVTQEITKKWP